ncbi:MAG TPA: tRNA (adenosine(37)-N6)-threonylcarbamoyltransferase complex ATPase subunit type 1 TsaE [Clostridiaceae bacterium]|nr:tRNA (adenosine(37)-N6)-threonylcarbamoyltransferase complex ATPase subunit type 1 TsaE [Clostridiaceae bacterium]
MNFTSNSPEDTEKIGMCLGSCAKKGYIICLIGDLGVGKTQFTKGIAKGLGVKDYVTSPTFTIINEYIGRLPIYHFDVYRIKSIEEMYDIGYEEFFYGDGVTIIEWADMIDEILPPDRINVTISKDALQGINFRDIKVESAGKMYEGLFRDILENCDF